MHGQDPTGDQWEGGFYTSSHRLQSDSVHPIQTTSLQHWQLATGYSLCLIKGKVCGAKATIASSLACFKFYGVALENRGGQTEARGPHVAR